MKKSKKEIILDHKYSEVLLEAIQESMYHLALKLDEMKGEPLSKERKLLTKKQKLIEELQHKIYEQIY